ncbi:MAG: hypothetical protein ACE5K7_08395 [Phycisphaerae bacterium]
MPPGCANSTIGDAAGAGISGGREGMDCKIGPMGYNAAIGLPVGRFGGEVMRPFGAGRVWGCRLWTARVG